jgi:hypothetical protein
VAKLLCEYEPYHRVGDLLRVLTGVMGELFAFVRAHARERKNYAQQRITEL